MKKLERHLGYKFKDAGLLAQALNHASTGGKSYERLEFLGDRVLSLVVANMIYETFPDDAEGNLAKRHSALVKQSTLTRVAADMDLSGHIKMSNITDSVLSDVVESVIGALFLDGGVEAASGFIRKAWGDLIASSDAPPEDSKSRLQEYAQGKAIPLPQYVVIERAGPDHAPMFTVEARLQGINPQRASAASKQAAEKLAAKLLLQEIDNG
jgi:ribonuclease-3